MIAALVNVGMVIGSMLYIVGGKCAGARLVGASIFLGLAFLLVKPNLRALSVFGGYVALAVGVVLVLAIIGTARSNDRNCGAWGRARRGRRPTSTKRRLDRDW